MPNLVLNTRKKKTFQNKNNEIEIVEKLLWVPMNVFEHT